MPVGALGDIRFLVSRERVLSPHEFTRSRKANYVEHPILGQKSTLQYMGVELFKGNLKIKLTAGFCIPEEEIERLFAMQEGRAYRLILGTENLGQYVVEDCEETRKWTDGQGLPLVIEARLALKEYSA